MRRAIFGAAAAVCLVLGLTACERGKVVKIDIPPDPDGGGGAGGCDPHDAFVASDGCYEPDPACCELNEADLAGHCVVATEGAMPVPYLCATEPSAGGTDGLACATIETTAFPCQWGTSVVLCCEEAS